MQNRRRSILSTAKTSTGPSIVPLNIPENRGDAMASFGSSAMDEIPDFKAVSSQSSTTGDSNKTSVSVWPSSLETCGGSFEAEVPHLEGPVVTTSHVRCIASQSSTADSSESPTSPVWSPVLEQSTGTLTPFPAGKKRIITTSHEVHTGAVSSQSSLADSSKCSTSPAWSAVVKGSAKPPALAVSASTTNAIGTSSTSSNKPCLKNPCSFAHGQLELTTRTMERDRSK